MTAERPRPAAGAAGTTDPLIKATSRRPAVWLLAILAGVGATVILLVVVNPFAARTPGGGVTDNADRTALEPVTLGSLSSQTDVAGTLGFQGQANSSPFAVINQATGTFTALPGAGQVIGCGQVLYRVANSPVVLLCGSTPAYRPLYAGDSGPDVGQLNRNLVALGYEPTADIKAAPDYFSLETEYALERLQAKLGVEETGFLNEGQAVFLPGPLRITTVSATLGSGASPGGQMAQATSTLRQVVVELNAADQSKVHTGDRVSITLPNEKTTRGVVTSVGAVAATSASGTTIPVQIAPLRSEGLGMLDQAPVQVQITTASVHKALIVPIDALLALTSGGYAVERVGTHGVHELIPVTLGLFDDADGLVQVSGPLAPGDQLVVPAT